MFVLYIRILVEPIFSIVQFIHGTEDFSFGRKEPFCNCFYSSFCVIQSTGRETVFFLLFLSSFSPHPTNQLQTAHPQYLHLSKLVSAIFLRLPMSLPPMVF